MTDNTIAYTLRMPRDLKKALTDKAKENGRSLNVELNMRLEESLKTEENQHPFAEPLRQIFGKLGELSSKVDNLYSLHKSKG